MKLATFEERFAEAHQLWTQLGVEECTETQLLGILGSYDEAVRGCRFREAANLQARVARLQSREAKAAEFWRLAACRSCRIRAAEALAATRYLCDDAEISRTVCHATVPLAELLATHVVESECLLSYPTIIVDLPVEIQDSKAVAVYCHCEKSRD